jgi:hypothetical protein
MPTDSPPYWLLISVLFSSLPLTPPLAMRLFETAYDLYRRDETEGTLSGEMLQGRVRNLKKQALLGAIAGPVFEAEIETERGAGMVRFLLTHQGIEHMAQTDLPN